MKSWHRIPVLNDNYIWIVVDKPRGVVIAVDPAVDQPVIEYLTSRDLALTHVLVTHHHYDHVGGIKNLKSIYGCTVVGSKKDKKRIPLIDKTVCEGDEINIGDFKFKVFETDGHTIGHVVYLEENLNWGFVGDTLFALGCGKMFEGTATQFEKSLSKIKNWSHDTLIFCTHEYTLANSNFAIFINPTNSALRKRITNIKYMRSRGEATVPFLLSDDLLTNPFLRLFDIEIQKNLNVENQDTTIVFEKLREAKDNFKI